MDHALFLFVVRASDGARDDPVLGDWECRRMTEWTARLHVAEIEPFRKAVSSARILRYMFLCPGPGREEGHPRAGFEGQFSPFSSQLRKNLFPLG